MRYLTLGFLLLVPGSINAAVILSEVAWMGSSASANHEWIELHNTGGSSVDVTGWKVTDGMNLSIPLTGSIAAGSYAVLERSSDASAAGSAFLLYTGALVNTGATLTLTRSDGGIEDQVSGGTDWKSIGGDNVTKETAQYTTAGWVTGVGTPGAANAGTPQTPEVEEEEEDTEEEEEETPPTTTPATPTLRSKSSSPSETVRLFIKDSTLAVAIDAQTVGYVHQTITYTAKPSSIGRSLQSSLIYKWNFGDGTVRYGKEVSHEYAYPGTYVVTLYTSYKNQKQISRHEITVLPVAMTLTKSRFGDIQINNDSPYEIDISGYAVAGEEPFVFPEYSVLLPNQTVTLPAHTSKYSHTWITNTVGKIVAAGFSAVTPTAQGSAPATTPILKMPAAVQSTPTPQVPVVSQFGFATTTPLQSSTTPASLQAAIITATATPALPKTGDSPWPYVGLIVIMTLGLIGTAFKVTRNQTG